MTSQLFQAIKPAVDLRLTLETTSLTALAATSLTALALLFASIENGFAQADSHSQSDKKSESGKSPRRDFHPKITGLKQSDEIPSNFPAPVYPSNVTSTHFVSTTKGHPAAAATLVTKDAADTVFAWYQAFCVKDKWTVKIPKGKARNKLEEEGRLYRLMASKGDQRMIISCTKSIKGASTLINISWTTKK